MFALKVTVDASISLLSKIVFKQTGLGRTISEVFMCKEPSRDKPSIPSKTVSRDPFVGPSNLIISAFGHLCFKSESRPLIIH